MHVKDRRACQQHAPVQRLVAAQELGDEQVLQVASQPFQQPLVSRRLGPDPHAEPLLRQRGHQCQPAVDRLRMRLSSEQSIASWPGCSRLTWRDILTAPCCPTEHTACAKSKKKLYLSRRYACHPCAGAMLIFSVSIQILLVSRRTALPAQACIYTVNLQEHDAYGTVSANWSTVMLSYFLELRGNTEYHNNEKS